MTLILGMFAWKYFMCLIFKFRFFVSLDTFILKKQIKLLHFDRVVHQKKN